MPTYTLSNIHVTPTHITFHSEDHTYESYNRCHIVKITAHPFDIILPPWKKEITPHSGTYYNRTVNISIHLAPYDIYRSSKYTIVYYSSDVAEKIGSSETHATLMSLLFDIPRPAPLVDLLDLTSRAGTGPS